MKAIDLDWLAQREPRHAGWLLLLLGLSAAGAGAWLHQQWSAEVVQLEARMIELRQSTRKAAFLVREPGRDQAALAQEAKLANRVVEQLNIPWPELFRDIEVASDASVALMAIQPDSTARSLRLEGEARDYASLLGFIGRLEETAAFSTVHVASHQVQIDSPARPVAFSVLTAWSADPR